MSQRMHDADPDVDPAQVRIFCEYNDRFGEGPHVTIAFLSAADEAAATEKALQVKALGMLDATWGRTGDVPATFFVDGYFDGNDYTAGFVAATSLPAELFEHLADRYEAEEFEPIRFMLNDADPAGLQAHLKNCCAFRSGTKMAEVIEADLLVVKDDGRIQPSWEQQQDDGKILMWSVRLPEAGKELIESIYLDHLADEQAEAAKP